MKDLKADRPSLLGRLVAWRHYTVTFGLVMPVACFALEFVLLPALGWLPGLVFFHRFRLFGYGVVALELITLALWLAIGPRLGRASAAVAGVLLAGALFAGVLGAVLLPFAIPGVLALGIGFLGFVPLFTAHVYARQGRAAFRQAEALDPGGSGRRVLFEALIWGGLLVYAIPGFVQARVTITTRALLRDVIHGDDAVAEAAVARLRPYAWVADFDPLRDAREGERNPARRERLADAYVRLAGVSADRGPLRIFDYDGPERLLPR